MKSNIEMSQEMIDRFESYLAQNDLSNNIKPSRFIETMKSHKNFIDFMNLDEQLHMEKRNPLIAVLGDSVSCGHFEMIDQEKFIVAHDPSLCYMEFVKKMLQEAYPMTCVSLVNSAIAGDNIRNMEKRLTRDIISFQPDLVVLNASLNWSKNRGTLDDFKAAYRTVVERVLSETTADLILLTPNVSTYEEELGPRVDFIRQLAEEYKVTLIDLHRMYTDVCRPEEYESVLANRENHPTVYGHKLFAKAIMKAMA